MLIPRLPRQMTLQGVLDEVVDLREKDALADLVNPICLEMDPLKAAQFSYDTTGLQSYVRENNPKYLNGIIRRLK